jgi:hypothetical protein
MNFRRRLDALAATLLPPTSRACPGVVTCDADGIINGGGKGIECWLGRHVSELPPDVPTTVVVGIDLAVVVGDKPGFPAGGAYDAAQRLRAN